MAYPFRASFYGFACPGTQSELGSIEYSVLPLETQDLWLAMTPVIVLMLYNAYVDMSRWLCYHNQVKREPCVSNTPSSSLDTFVLFYEELVSQKPLGAIRRPRAIASA